MYSFNKNILLIIGISTLACTEEWKIQQYNSQSDSKKPTSSELKPNISKQFLFSEDKNLNLSGTPQKENSISGTKTPSLDHVSGVIASTPHVSGG